eukprot:g58139.t1
MQTPTQDQGKQKDKRLSVASPQPPSAFRHSSLSSATLSSSSSMSFFSPQKDAPGASATVRKPLVSRWGLFFRLFARFLLLTGLGWVFCLALRRFKVLPETSVLYTHPILNPIFSSKMTTESVFL